MMSTNAQSFWIWVGALGLFAYFYGGDIVSQFNKDVARHADEFEKSIEKKVVKDAADQLEIVIRNGSPVDACVHAGILSAAFVQAKDETNYKAAKELEDFICRKAGLR